MRYAELRRTGKIIVAEKASPYGEYRCPTCKADVFLKSGKVYVTHFAHMPGKGKPECDDYHPQEDLRRVWQVAAPEPHAQKIDRLLLSIELEPAHDARRGPRGWGLRVTVPKSPDSHGNIRIDLGGGDLKPVSLIALSLSARTYRADPATHDFGAVWVSPEVSRAYREAVQHRIAGLTPTAATAFSAVPQKRKPRCGAVRWGESYYFIWRTDNPLEFPPSLLRHALGNNRDWSCCLLTLPDKAEPEVALWLERTCDLQVAPSRREWALLYPPPYEMDDDGNLIVPSVTQLLLAVKPLNDSVDGEITCSSAERSQSLHLSGAGPHVIEIAVEQQRLPRPIYLSWDEMPLNSLAAKPYPEPPAEPAILLEPGMGQSKAAAILHGASGRALLTRARAGEERVSAIRAYPGLSGRLLFRRTGQFDWQIEELRFSQTDAFGSAGVASLSAAQLDRVNEVLRDRALDVIVDFGPFGQYFAKAPTVTETRTPAFRIPQRLRQRIEWLCKASGAFVDKRRRPVGALEDAALIRHLSSAKLPVSLLANGRAIECALRRTESEFPS